jgi:uncharacterized protein YlxW (UPF0749 family)
VSEPSPRGWRGLLRPRARVTDLTVAVLLGTLGFATAVQVRATQDDGVLASARQEDLVQILDDLQGRSDRLRLEVDTLTATQQRLTTGTDRSSAALQEARRRSQLLGVLAGTVAARGPGITLTIDDPEGRVSADVLLDALEELRDAGAEAVMLEGSGGSAPAARVRVVASTALLDEDGGVLVDGIALRPPYRYTALGDPATLAAALAIPGGVEDTVARAAGKATVDRSTDLRVGVLRPLTRPRYARPVPDGG